MRAQVICRQVFILGRLLSLAHLMIWLANSARSISSMRGLRILSLHVRQPMRRRTINSWSVYWHDDGSGLSVFVQATRRIMEGIILVPIHDPMHPLTFKFCEEVSHIRIGCILLMLLAESILLRKGIISKNKTSFVCHVSSCTNTADLYLDIRFDSKITYISATSL